MVDEVAPMVVGNDVATWRWSCGGIRQEGEA